MGLSSSWSSLRRSAERDEVYHKRIAGSPWHRLPILLLRVATLVAASSWTTYLLGSFRTSQFGPSWRQVGGSLLLAAIFLLPVAAATLVGLRRRHYRMALIAAVVLPVLLAEIPAQAQELAFRLRHGDRSVAKGGVLERRWWPYRHHVLGYDPAAGRWWGDC